MMHRRCFVLCLWFLQVIFTEQNFIHAVDDPIIGKKNPSPVYLHGPLVPYFVPQPPGVRMAQSSPLAGHRPMHTLHVPPNNIHPGHMLPHAQKLPAPHLPIHSTHPNTPVLHNPLPKVPNVIVTPPMLAPRTAVHPLSPLNPSPFSHLPDLHPTHPLIMDRPAPNVGVPRHLTIHKHFHGGDFHHSDFHHSGIDHSGFHVHDIHHHHHAIPINHHHFHHKPHGVVIKKTIIKKFRDAGQPHLRMRRALPAVLATKLATDPKSKVDLMTTLDNFKDATANVCESIQSPVYHVRDAIGSARDVVFSMMKMSPTGLLIPSTYGIMELKPSAEIVGGINPEIAKYDNTYDGNIETETEIKTNELTDGNTGDTLTAVQFMLRNGFRKAKDSVQHAGDAVHSMRRAVLTVPHSALKLLYPFYKSIELQQDKDGFRPTGLLGAQQVVPEPTPRLVGAGRLLDLLRAAASEDKPEPVYPVGSVKAYVDEGREKYTNFIKKLRNDVRGKFQQFN